MYQNLSIRRRVHVASCLVALALLPSFGAMAAPQTEAAFTPGAIWPDDKGVHINAHGGGLLQHDGVYYWFGEHKVAGPAGNTAKVGVHVYSSKDLTSWRDEGIALAVAEDPLSDIASGSAASVAQT